MVKWGLLFGILLGTSLGWAGPSGVDTLPAKAASLDLHVGGSYGIPQFDVFFDEGFEGRLGWQTRLRIQQSRRFKVGFGIGYQRFRPFLDNLTDVRDARYYWIMAAFSYSAVQAPKHTFEPVLEVHYNLINYNYGAQIGGGMGLTPGVQYLYWVQPEYALEIAVMLKNVFTRFGGNLNPVDAGIHQFFDIRFGITVPL